jgi:WhiB family redox-sensing transcriptional regulator
MSDPAPGATDDGDACDPLTFEDWREAAACRGSNPATFFPERGDTAGVERAKAVCAECPVQLECLEENLFEDDGIFGGLSGRQRRQMRSRIGQVRLCRECDAPFDRVHPGQAYCSVACKNARRDPVRRVGL